MKDIIIILGPPCCGKGTICNLLSQKINYEHISIGELLRINYPIGTEIRTLIDSGRIADNSITIKLLSKLKGKKIILDGFPRSKEQLEILNQFNNKISHAFIINTNENTLIKRMNNRTVCNTCEKFEHIENCKGKMIKRHDDNLEIYKARFNKYHENIHYIKEYLKTLNINIKYIDNNEHHSIEEILKEIISKIN